MKKNTLKRLSALFATAIMAVSFGSMKFSAEGTRRSINLSDATAIGGKYVTVDLSTNTGNTCTGFVLDVEFDPSLTLVKADGAMAYEVNGNVVTLVCFTGTVFVDDESIVTLTFEVSESAVEGETFNVGISNIDSFADSDGEAVPVEEVEEIAVEESEVEVVESAKPVTNHMVYEDSKGKTAVALRGDVNYSGAVDLMDVIAVARYTAGLVSFDTEQVKVANVNEDGAVNLFDVLAICKYINSGNGWN